MKNIKVLMLCVALLSALSGVMAKTAAEPIQISKKQMDYLQQIVPELQKSLNQTDQNIAKALASTKFESKDEEQIRGLLRAIIEQDSLIVNACFADTRSVLEIAEPSEYKHLEGSDISGQSHMIELAKKKKPLLSACFETEAGFHAVVNVHPLFAKKKKFLGSISIMIRPDRMATTLLNNLEIPKNYELWMMQTDGMIVSDQNPEKIGRMLFDDELNAQSPSFVELARKIAAAASGKGEYSLIDPQMQDSVTKAVAWDTVSLHGRQWRVVLQKTQESQANMCLMYEGFSKRIFTPRILAGDVNFLLSNVGGFIASQKNKTLSKAFVEKIMSVVTGVNGCVYCSWFHAKQASDAGLDQAEIDDLFLLQFDAQADEFELPALKYAQHFAETGRHPDPEETAAFVNYYGQETADEIMLYIRMILLGNLMGNTYDAFLSRLKGSPAADSNVIFETLFFVSVFPMMYPASLLMAKKGESEIERIAR